MRELCPSTFLSPGQIRFCVKDWPTRPPIVSANMLNNIPLRKFPVESPLDKFQSIFLISNPKTKKNLLECKCKKQVDNVRSLDGLLSCRPKVWIQNGIIETEIVYCRHISWWILFLSGKFDGSILLIVNTLMPAMAILREKAHYTNGLAAWLLQWISNLIFNFYIKHLANREPVNLKPIQKQIVRGICATLHTYEPRYLMNHYFNISLKITKIFSLSSSQSIFR